MAALALTLVSGCAVTLQNRYSVFGSDRPQSDPSGSEGVWPTVLFGLALLAAFALGAGTMHLGKRLCRRKPISDDRADGTTEVLTPAPEPQRDSWAEEPSKT